MSSDDFENERSAEHGEFIKKNAEPVEGSASNDSPDELTNHQDAPNVILAETVSQREPGRLHPTSLVFDLLSHVRSLIVPLVLVLFGAAQGNTTYLIIAAVFFVPTVVFSVIRYLSLKYQIFNGKLTVTSGIFFRRVRTVPVERIQNIDLVQNVLHRIFNVAEVRVETASGTEPEATLRVLSLNDVDRLRSLIFDSTRQVGPVGLNPVSDVFDGSANQDVASSQLLHTISIPMLCKAGLASSRGMVLIGVLAGLYFQFDLEDWVKWNQIEKWIPQGLSILQQTLAISVAVIVTLLFLRVLGVAWYLLRFYDYRLTRTGNDLRISCGLFTKVSATVPRNRIQFISVHKNWIMRLMGLATIRIETAGGSASQGEDATKSVSSRWFVPVIKDEDVATIIEQLRPNFTWNDADLVWQPLAAGAGTRKMRIGLFLSVLVAAIGLAVTRPWGWIAGPVVLPFFIFHALKKAKSMSYARTKDGVMYRSGVLTRKTSITFFEKIQTLEVSQTPFDKRWKMATLSVDTAAAGPANHRIDIAYLPEEFVYSEFNVLIQHSASHQPVYG